MAELERLVGTAVRMMDNAIDVSRFPLEMQAQEARAKRRIGLGVTGLADALIFCRVKYGSPHRIELLQARVWGISHAAYFARVGLAKEKGPFPPFDKDSQFS